MENNFLKLTIDRIEEEIAVCETEDGRTVEIPVSLIQGQAHEGAIITPAAYMLLEEEEKEKREENFRKTQLLFRN